MNSTNTNNAVQITVKYEIGNRNISPERTEQVFTRTYTVDAKRYQRALDSFAFEYEMALLVPMHIDRTPNMRSYTKHAEIIQVADVNGAIMPLPHQSKKGQREKESVIRAARSIAQEWAAEDLAEGADLRGANLKDAKDIPDHRAGQ